MPFRKRTLVDIEQTRHVRWRCIDSFKILLALCETITNTHFLAPFFVPSSIVSYCDCSTKYLFCICLVVS